MSFRLPKTLKHLNLVKALKTIINRDNLPDEFWLVKYPWLKLLLNGDGKLAPAPAAGPGFHEEERAAGSSQRGRAASANHSARAEAGGRRS